MKYDSKREIFSIINEPNLSKSEMIERIKALYSGDANGNGGSNDIGGDSGNNNGEDESDSQDGEDFKNSGNENKNSGSQNSDNAGNSQTGQDKGDEDAADEEGDGTSSGDGLGNKSDDTEDSVADGDGSESGSSDSNTGASNGSQNKQSSGSGEGNSTGTNDASQNSQNGQSRRQGNSSQNAGSQSSQASRPQSSAQSGTSSQNGQSSSSQNSQQGQSQNGQSSSSQSSQNSQNSQQGQSQNSQQSGTPDQYSIGYYMGRMYAEEMFKHGGLKPIMGNIFEIPNLPDMDLFESLCESVDDDILSILNDSSLSKDEMTNKIYDLFRNSLGKPKGVSDDSPKEVYVPDDVIIMRNGHIDENNLMVGAHVVDKSIGDEIRKENGIMPKDPDWGLSDDEDAMVKEAFPLINDIFKPYPKDTEEERETAETFKNKIQGRIRKSREGIIDWKRALQEFVSEKSKKHKKGSIRKNVYDTTGIVLKHRVKDYTNYNKCVVYIDTSGSVNNRETQLIPIMAGEISKIMKDCHFRTVDIHLFDDYVYDTHYDIDYYTVADENWGIEGADDGGGTNIGQVYKHIKDTYVDDGEFLPDVSAVIIITDVSGMEDTGSIKPYLKYFGERALSRLLYVIYNDYSSKFISEINETMSGLVSKESQFFVISVEAFKKQLLGESMIQEVNKYKINEALGSIDSIKKKKEARAQIDDRSEAERAERLRKAELQGARAIGKLENFIPEVISTLERYFPGFSSAKEYNSVVNNKNTYYVTDDVHIIINGDFDNSNINNLFEACGKLTIDQIIGDIVLRRPRNFTGFPKGFPKEVVGSIIIQNAPRFASLENMPKTVTGDIHLKEVRSKFIDDDAIDEYYATVGKEVPDFYKRNNLGKVFQDEQNVETNESMMDEILNRFNMGQAYLNEAMGKLSPIIPSRSKPQGGSKMSMDEWERLNAVAKKNKAIVEDVINPIISIPWGDLDDDSIEVIRGVENIKEDMYIKDFEGVKIITDNEDIIGVVYAKKMGANKPKVIYFRDDNGNDIFDENEIVKAIKERAAVLSSIRGYFDRIGYNPRNLPEYSEEVGAPTITRTLLSILYQSMCGLLEAKYDFIEYGKYIYNPNGLSNKELFEYVFDKLVGSGYWRKRGQKDYSYVIGTNYGKTVNFRGTSQQKQDFEIAVYGIVKDRGINLAEFFKKDVLKAIALGCSIKDNSDGLGVIPLSVVNGYGRDELVELLGTYKDVDIRMTGLKSLNLYSSYGKDMDNPSAAVQLFPDKMSIEYRIDVPVSELELSKIRKVVGRSFDKSGVYGERSHRKVVGFDENGQPVYGDVPSGEVQTYDWRTGERRGSSVGVNKKISVESIESEGLILDVIDDMKSRLNKVKTSIRIIKGLEYSTKVKGIKNSARLKELFEKGVKIARLIYDSILPMDEMKKSEYSEKTVEALDNINDRFKTIYDMVKDYEGVNFDEITQAEAASIDYEFNKILSEISTEVDAIDKNCTTLGAILDNATDLGTGNLREKSVRGKLVKKEIRKERNQGNNKSSASDTISQNKNVDSDFEELVNKISSATPNVIRILNSVDFSNADEDAVEDFGTKEEMIRKISLGLGKVVEYGNLIISTNDVDSSASNAKIYKEIAEICDSINVYAMDLDEYDAEVTLAASELSDVLRKVSRELRKASARKSEKEIAL